MGRAFLTRTRVQAVLRTVIGLIFLGTGILKVVHPAGFYSDLVAYRIPAPDGLLRSVAIFVPWLEVLCGGLVVINLWWETVRVVVTGLCLVFVLALGQAVARGLDLDCGCFGSLHAGGFDRPPMALARALFLLGASIWLLIQPISPRKETVSSVTLP